MNSKKSVASRAGQLLFVGFPGTSAPEVLLKCVREGRVGGVVLFLRNVESPEQVRELIGSLLSAAPSDAPLLVAIDQEGGRVQRLREPWTEWPPMRRVATRGDPTKTAAVAAALARELRELGIDLDFAPVVDVDTNPANPVIGDRAFGATPEEVGRHVARLRHGAPGRRRGGLRQAFPRPRRHRRRTATTSCRAWTTTSSGCAASSCRRSAPRSRPASPA